MPTRAAYKRLAVLIALSLAVLAVVPKLATAQYKSLPVDERSRALGVIAKRYVKSPTGGAEDRQKLDDYLFKYHLPKMTQTDAGTLGQLGNLRFDLLRGFLRPAEPALAAELTSRIFDDMKKVVESNEFHRAVRYSALLLIGQLDARYGSDNANDNRPPQPWPTADQYLCRICEAGLEKNQIPPELVVAALVGLDRHAKFAGSLPQSNRDELLRTLLAIANRDRMPHDLSREAEQWLTLRACTALSRFGQLGPGNQIHNALAKRVADESYDIDTRARIASLMGDIDYSAASGLNEAATARGLLSLATAIGSSEAKFAEEFEESQINPGLGGGFRGGGRSSGRGGGIGFGSGEIELPSEYKRSRLATRMTHLSAAVTSVEQGIQQEQAKQALTAIAEAVQPVLELAIQKVDLAEEDKVNFEIAEAAKMFDSEVKAIANVFGVKPEENAIEATDEEDEAVEDDTATAAADDAAAETAPVEPAGTP